MTIHYCPHCNKRYIVSFDTTDYIHECNSGNLTLDQDDVVIVGNWEDSDGSSGVRHPQEVMRAGMVNELQGRRPQIEEGKDKEAITRRGVRASTRRQTQHSEFINLKKGGLD